MDPTASVFLPAAGPAVPAENASKKNPPRRRNPRQDGTAQSAGTDPNPAQRAGRQPSSNEASTSSVGASRDASKSRKTRRPRPPPSAADAQPRDPADSQPKREGNRRKANFGSGLTHTDAPADNESPEKRKNAHPRAGNSDGTMATANSRRPQEKRRANHLPQGDDLTSSLIRQLSTPPYPDCSICFSAIRPDHAIWSCSPSIQIITSSETQIQQYCWSSFHVKCIRSWADKSVKEVAEAWRARGEPNKKGDWRCPGCQGKREAVPSGYWCFCNSTSEPKPLRLSTPHSCGNSCSRPRESGCGHPCPLQCHPGPCPPCQVTTRSECYCPQKNILTFRCGIDARQGARSLSCGKVCGRALGCGKHACERVCHDGPCDKCVVTEDAACWCGKETRLITCGEGRPIECFVEGQKPWIGRFSCDSICDRLFDCGIHHCKKSCHPPSSKPAVCPRSPSKITRCPCGQNAIAPDSSADRSQYAFPTRTACTDPIPTCTSRCFKPHPACSHACTARCHTGPCPPCPVQIVRPCRCGATTKSMACHDVLLESATGAEEKEILCDKPCQALRACGNHRCNRLCCPLASLAMTTKKGKRRVAVEDNQGIGEEQGGLHECDLVCGKLLSCGNHRCERREHRLGCPPCLQSSFEELICPCGRTVYEPPIPCGTRMECHYPCARPPPACGHASTPHSCHADTVPCPPCVHLASKECACGKKVVPNVRCSLETEKISCGTVCGKLMACGFHLCQRLCHGDACGGCTAPCGKTRKSCLPNNHPCTRPCHAPSGCPGTEPCEALITLSCPCGRIRQPVHCGKSVTSRGSESTQALIKCSTDCQIAKRNARLADALGISPETQNKASATATYNDDVVAFARANSKFLPIVERAFADFFASEKRTQVLPHMPQERRKFVHDLAAVYRIDTQMIDQEPKRSVQLLRRLDTRIPSPLLSAYIASAAPPPSLGKLADFRSIKGTQASSWRTGPPGSSAPSSSRPASTGVAVGGSASTPRGWTSVVARPATAASSTSVAIPRPTASLASVSAGALASRLAGPAASASHTRTSSPANLRATSPAAGATLDGDVPDNWEDDV